MALSSLHTISGITIFFFILAKIILHFYLDRKSEKSFSIINIVLMPLYYLKPYSAEIAQKYQSLKKYCNLLLVAAYFSILVNLLIGILIYLQV